MLSLLGHKYSTPILKLDTRIFMIYKCYPDENFFYPRVIKESFFQTCSQWDQTRWKSATKSREKRELETEAYAQMCASLFKPEELMN